MLRHQQPVEDNDHMLALLQAIDAGLQDCV
jgi:hypothetical protein